MSLDDLHRPLGLHNDIKPNQFSDYQMTKIAFVGLLLAGSSLISANYILKGPASDLSVVTVQIDRNAPSLQPAQSSPQQLPPALPPPLAVTEIPSPLVAEMPKSALAARPGQDVTGTIPGMTRAGKMDVEIKNGVKIYRPNMTQPAKSSVVQLPEQDISIQLTKAPDPRLIEKGAHGPLPKIAPDGAKPMEVYGRPAVTPSILKGGAPQMVLVVGGMGLNASATQMAAERLPGAITLAFAPYGIDLDKQVSKAREAGHEILLQLPMESFGGPRENPGPHSLTTDAKADVLKDNLHWLMSRFTGYVGVSNFLGAKFTSNEQALSQILKDTAKRGLIYFDDGSSPRTLAPGLAANMNIAFAGADVVIDSNPEPEAISAALSKLEALARQKGLAIGFANGLPAGVDPIANFAKSLPGRGILLTPLSASLGKGQTPVAGLSK